MTTITADRATKTLTVEGHAGAKRNEQGHDLVCCALSTLAQCYYYAGLKKGYMMELQSDQAYLMARPDARKADAEEIAAIFEGYALGMELIAENYPEHVQIMWISADKRG